VYSNNNNNNNNIHTYKCTCIIYLRRKFTTTFRVIIIITSPTSSSSSFPCRTNRFAVTKSISDQRRTLCDDRRRRVSVRVVGREIMLGRGGIKKSSANPQTLFGSICHRRVRRRARSLDDVVSMYYYYFIVHAKTAKSH